MKEAFDAVIGSSNAGAAFVFGKDTLRFGPIAFSALPIIIFVSALSAILYHLRVVQAVVVIAELMVPERATPLTAGKVTFEPDVITVNVMDAAASACPGSPLKNDTGRG